MYCVFCGKEISANAAFCGHCGQRLTTYKSNSMNEKQNIPHKTKKKAINMALGICGIVFVVVLVFGAAYSLVQPRVTLKYEWGTSMPRIERLEEENEVPNTEYATTIICKDQNQEADKLHGFEYECVKYRFGNAYQLVTVQCDFQENYSAKERRRIAEKKYGNNYFVAESENDSTDIWWIDDTIICLTDENITYFDAEYFVAMKLYGRTYCNDLLDFFEKYEYQPM